MAKCIVCLKRERRHVGFGTCVECDADWRKAKDSTLTLGIIAWAAKRARQYERKRQKASKR
jgi:hypothetical protein